MVAGCSLLAWPTASGAVGAKSWPGRGRLVASAAAVDVTEWGASGDGETDDTGALAAAVQGAGEVFFPPGTYRISRPITVPSHVRLFGAGAQSTLKITAVDPTAAVTNYHAFQVPDGATDVRFQALRFVGDNAPFVPVYNNQSAAIDIAGTTATDITVSDCVFEDLWGFSVHNGGTSSRVTVTGCAFRRNANGLNVNGNYSTQTHNTFEHSEGLEASGAYSVYAENYFLTSTGTLGALSLGGTTSPGSERPGNLVRGNIIYDAGGYGISVNDGFVDGAIIGNEVYRARKIGISLTGSGVNGVRGIIVADNTVVSSGHIGESTRGGMLLNEPVVGCIVSGNRVLSGGDASYQPLYGLLCYGTRNTFHDNTFEGLFKDVSLVGAIDVGWRGNRYDPMKLELRRGASLSTE
ncbi:MAG: right-handed parallel beta-helix repeat-containing protein [Chloroflexota bacterium]|nr:right-handed parallel beta-helix repeat-containing protein [Chloroflexota bacterium]